MNKDIQNRFLQHSDPNVVYDWLKSNAHELATWFDNKPVEELMLLERKEPLIDLALALFSKNRKIRSTLFDREDSTLQKAVLTNKNCGYFPALENLLKKENTEYLEILLTNTEDRFFLVDFFKKESIFSKIKKSYWLRLLEIASRNKILTYPYSEDDPEWEDDIDVLAYATRLYRSIYGLFDMLDATNKNVELLSELVTRLPAIQNFHLVNLDVPKMIKKWQNKKPVKHSDYIYFHEHKNDWDTTCDKKFTKIERRCWTEWKFVTCRTHLADAVLESKDEFKKFKDSDDIALRLAYYRNENFNWNEEKSNELLENWNNYRKRDGYLFIENIVENNSIYWNKKIIDYIGDGFILSETYMCDEYRNKLKKVQENNPKYFADNSQIENIESELFSLKNDVNLVSIKIEKSKRVVLSQRKISFFIVFLLVVITMFSWS